MKLIYTPEGGPEQTYPIRRLMVVEFEAINKYTGYETMPEFGEALNKGNPTALRALVWVLWKRADPTLKYADVDFAVEEMTVELEEGDEGYGEDDAAEDEDDGSVLPKGELRAVGIG